MQKQLLFLCSGKQLISSLMLYTFFLLVTWQGQSQYAAENLTPAAIIKEGLSIEQAPDGRIFIAERGGIVKVYQNGTVSNVFTVTTTTDNEQGLLGLTLHPDFAANGYIYVFYSIVDNGVIRHRIERVKVNTASQEVSRQEILLLEPIGGGFHNGGDLKFFNGFLYITVGDSQQNTNAQNLDTYKGKILRVTEDGQPAPGNPFFGNGSVQKQSIWVYGFRNPWRLVPNVAANKLFVLDVGTSWEEINEISNPALRNYGWGHPQGGDGIQTETNLFTNPIFTYATGSIGNALTNGVLYNPATVRYPDLAGKFLIKDFLRKEIRQFDYTVNNPVSTIVYETPHQMALGMMVGNDGYIYYCSYGGNGDLIRVNYIQNTIPTIVNHPVSQTIMETNAVTFNVDVTGVGQINYQWQFNTANIAGANAASYTIPAVNMANGGNYRCVVSNNVGSVTSNAAVLTVAPFSNAPEVSIVLPLPTLKWNADDVINFEATATDVEDGVLPASAFSWSMDLFHEDIPGAGHSHPGASPQGVKSGTFTASNQGEKTPNVWYRFTVKVTDSNGLTATKFVDVHPNLVNVTAASLPASLLLELNQKQVTAPATRQVVANAALQTLNAPTPQFVGNTRYDFDHWSHGGGANQSFQAPAQGDITYTAVYTATDISQAPYQGIIAQIPGVIEAENYDIGTGAFFDNNGGGDTAYRAGDGVGTEGCSEGGFNLGWVAKDEWLKYTSNITTTGNYDIKLRIATPNNNRLLHFEVDGVNITGPVSIPNTGGFQAWQTATISNVFLTQGSHVITLYFDAADTNVNKFEFVFTGSANAAPIADFEASAQVVCTGTQVTFTSVSLGTIETYNWNFGAGAAPATATGVGPHTVTYATEGVKTVILTALNTIGSSTKTASVQSNICTGTAQSPYGGMPKIIPGRVEIEEYDLDGEGVAYHDISAGNAGNAFRTDGVDLQNASEGTYNVGWVQSGEWMEYTTFVAQHGDYNIKFRISSPYDNRKLHLEQNGVNITGSVAIPNTGGFQNWQTVTVSDIHLHEGASEFRLVFESDDVNVNYIDFEYILHPPVADFVADSATVCTGSQVTFTSAATGLVDTYNWNFGAGAVPATATGIGPHAVTYSTEGAKTITFTTTNTAGSSTKTATVQSTVCGVVQAPYSGTPKMIPGHIEIEEYDLGGEGVAYHDLSTGNAGNVFRTDNVDLENTSEGTYNVGWVQTGEWLEYSTVVAQAGSYSIKLRVSTPYNNKFLHLEQDGTNISGSVAIPNSDGFQNWQTVVLTNIQLHGGASKLRVVFESDDINVNYIDIESAALAVPTADFLINNQESCVGTQVVFTSAATGIVDSYAWNFGTGATPSAATGIGPHTVTYSSEGTKIVTLTVTNTSGSTAKTANVVATVCNVGNAPLQKPYNGTPKAVPGRVQAEEYDLDGEGIAYHDTTTGNSGNAFRNDGVDLQQQAPGNYNIGWVAASEWVEYTINVTESGYYNINLRASSPYNDRKLRLELNDQSISGNVAIPNSGGFGNWQTVTVGNVYLEAGSAEFRVIFGTNHINLDYVDFTKVVNATTALNVNSDENNIPVTQKITVYPNPSTGIYNLSQDAEWSIYSTLGSKVKEGKGSAIDITDSAAGVYFVTLKDNTTTLRIIKQ